MSKFGDAYQVEMYFENVDGYEGEKEIMSKFGLQMNEDVTFVVSRRRFEQLVSTDSNLIVKSRPNEGDLIYFDKVKKCWNIFCRPWWPFLSSTQYLGFKFKCKTFQYSGEDLDTGIAEIDAIEDANTDMLQHQLTLEDGTDKCY